MIKAKFVSSLEKVFLDEKLDTYPELEKISALRGERISFQLISIRENPDRRDVHNTRAELSLDGELAKHATVHRVVSVPVDMPLHPNGSDDNYLRVTPGLYPDVLSPLYYGGKALVVSDALSAIWIEISIPEDFSAGKSQLTATLALEGHTPVSCTLEIDVIGATLPKEDIMFTEWFHADCLANYYNVESFSDRHFEIIENFVKTARRGGINTLLTPVFTPPLDTAIGGERRTTQLVGVNKRGNEYDFNFTLLDRWIDMCQRCGIDYYEISHLFTQWGVKCAPKIMGYENGEYKRLFGWETRATSDEYRTFIRAFLKELLAHMKKRGCDKKCIFHISDEPSLECMENYRAAKESVADILDGYYITDALSNYDFYKSGIVDHPVPSSNRISPFIDGGVSNLWTYYCVSQYKDVSNRYMSMPAWRTRSIGMQIYKYNIKGFLHWGYNFYNNQYSVNAINPYLDTSAGHAFPSGDSFSVYPAPDGTALESTRFVVFYEALQDIKAMKLAESFYGHAAVVAAIEEEFGATVTFDTCTKSAECSLRIRERINSMIKAAISKN